MLRGGNYSPKLYQTMAYRPSKCHMFWKYYPWMCRCWGILTATGLWGIGAESCYHKSLLGIYLLFVAAVMSFLEIVFVMSICVVLCVGDEQVTLINCWKKVLWLDDFKKGIFYFVLSTGCFVPQSHGLWLPIISGVMMLISGVLYCIKTYKTRQDEKLRQLADNRQTYDKFDDVTVDIEENFARGNHVHQPIPIPQEDIDSESSSDDGGLAGQDEILEV